MSDADNQLTLLAPEALGTNRKDSPGVTVSQCCWRIRMEFHDTQRIHRRNYVKVCYVFHVKPFLHYSPIYAVKHDNTMTFDAFWPSRQEEFLENMII